MVAEGGEGENPLPFSLQPQNAERGGGGRGGIPASFPSRSPPPKQPFQPTPTPSPGSPWRPGPQAPGAWTATLTGSLPASRVFNFLLRLKPMGPGLKTLGCYHNPQSADLGGRWMVSEGGALHSHDRRPFQPLGRAPRFWGPGQQAPEPCIPAA